MTLLRPIHTYRKLLHSSTGERTRFLTQAPTHPFAWLQIVALLLLAVMTGAAQQSVAASSTPATAPQDPAATAAPTIPPMPAFQGRDDLILKHLDTLLPWYHNLGNGLPTVGLPSDAIYQSTARTLALQALQAAFQSAIADAALIAHASAGQGLNETSQDFARIAPQIDAQIAQIKSQLESISVRIPQSSGSSLAALQEQRTRLQGDLELLNAENAAVDQLAKSSAGNSANDTSSLQRSIAQLERTVPELGSSASPANFNAAASTSKPTSSIAAPPTGLIGEAELLFEQASSLHKIDVLALQTVAAQDLAKQLRTPLVDEIHKTLNLAASWAASPQAPAQSLTKSPVSAKAARRIANQPAQPGPTKQQFDELTARFKRLSAAAMPLSQEIIYLDQTRSNLTQWRQTLAQENRELLRSVLTRVFTIAIALGVLIVLSAIWRRFIFRYVHDVRRRRQVLILRRFIIGLLMGVVIILGFVSEFSSLATFAGFITAGIAVGLQTILLSVAAYFFLIGRYGIRVGDRISISGITGDVVDVGLVRLYILELAGTGTDIFPTGRIVVFPNSVLFQATVPLFKQIPGTDYAWHEVAMLLTSNADARAVSDSVLAAVRHVHEGYRSNFERQHAESSRRIDLVLEVPAPTAQLQYAATGLELVVRYPVGLTNTAKADQQVTQAVLDVIHGSPDMKTAISGNPQIRVAVKG